MRFHGEGARCSLARSRAGVYRRNQIGIKSEECRQLPEVELGTRISPLGTLVARPRRESLVVVKAQEQHEQQQISVLRAN